MHFLFRVSICIFAYRKEKAVIVVILTDNNGKKMKHVLKWNMTAAIKSCRQGSHAFKSRPILVRLCHQYKSKVISFSGNSRFAILKLEDCFLRLLVEKSLQNGERYKSMRTLVENKILCIIFFLIWCPNFPRKHYDSGYLFSL